MSFDSFTLIFEGKRLNDTAILAEYGVTHGSTVHLILRLD
jgi:hypothetical protein